MSCKLKQHTILLAWHTWCAVDILGTALTWWVLCLLLPLFLASSVVHVVHMYAFLE